MVDEAEDIMSDINVNLSALIGKKPLDIFDSSSSQPIGEGVIGLLDRFPELCFYDDASGVPAVEESKQDALELKPSTPPRIDAKAASHSPSRSPPSTPPRSGGLMNSPQRQPQPPLPPSLTSRFGTPSRVLPDRWGQAGLVDDLLFGNADGEKKHPAFPMHEIDNVVCGASGKKYSKFLYSILHFEWIALIASQCLRPARMSSVQIGIIDIGRVSLRRLMNFYRTSLMEVCRYSSAKCCSQVLTIFIYYITT